MEKKVVSRVYYLDWLRVIGILLVLVYHSSRFFNMETWDVKNPIWYPWVEVWNRFATSWMMPLMFAISGASLFYAIGKGGAGKFIKDKVLRLLVPLVVFELTHASVQVYVYRLTHGQFTGSYFQFLPTYYSIGTFDTSGKHLWYLQVLFVSTLLLYPVMRWLKGGGRGLLSRFGDLLALPGAVYVLALPALLMDVLVNPSSPVKENNAGWPYIIYLWLVLAGFLVISNERLQENIRRMRWLSLAVGLVCIGCFIPLYGLAEGPAYGTARFALSLGLRSIGSWCCVMAFLGFGSQYLEKTTPSLKYANEAVLPFYILHQTVLLSVGYFVVQWAIPSLIKWLIILVVSFSIIMILYEFLVRRFNIMRFLFGMKPLVKQPIPRPQEAAAASSPGASPSP